VLQAQSSQIDRGAPSPLFSTLARLDQDLSLPSREFVDADAIGSAAEGPRTCVTRSFLTLAMKATL